MPTLQSEPYVPSGASLMYSALVQGDSGPQRAAGWLRVCRLLIAKRIRCRLCEPHAPSDDAIGAGSAASYGLANIHQEVVNAEGIAVCVSVRASPLTSPSSTRPHEVRCTVFS